MQNLIICIIVSMFFGSILSFFLDSVKKKNGDDFNFKEFIQNIGIKKIDFKIVIIYFIILYILTFSLELEEVIMCSILCFSLLLAFIIDLIFMIIPDTSSLLILALGIAQNFMIFSKENFFSSIAGMIIASTTFFSIDWICRKLTKKSGFGMGDIKLFGALGFFFGIKDIIVIMFLSIMLSAIFSICFLIVKAVKKFKEEYIPFAPFIVISSFIVYIVSADNIIGYYTYILDKLII